MGLNVVARTRTVSKRPAGRPTLRIEPLEARRVLSTVHAAALPSAGLISGTITNDVSGRGVGHIRVQLINADNHVLATTLTGPRGRYGFRVPADGPYVVHAIIPSRFVQASPQFVTTEPAGGYAINPATGQSYNGDSWNYRTGNNNPANGPVGPASWSTITTQGNAPFESPINLNGAPIDLSQYLTIHYASAAPTQVINNGSQIQAQFAANGADTITLAGISYNLLQLHYHDPAENLVNGTTYPMEEHFVNLSASGAETVVAVFLQLGAHNDALDPILNAASHSLTKPGDTTTSVGAIDFSGLLPTSRMGWFYEGSLTSPPLASPLNWLILSTPITLDYAQLQQYEAVASGAGFNPNARAIQPLDGRTVNQFNIDVNFQGQSIADANFTVAPASKTVGASTAGRARGAQALALTATAMEANSALSLQAAINQGTHPAGRLQLSDLPDVA